MKLFITRSLLFALALQPQLNAGCGVSVEVTMNLQSAQEDLAQLQKKYTEWEQAILKAATDRALENNYVLFKAFHTKSCRMLGAFVAEYRDHKEVVEQATKFKTVAVQTMQRVELHYKKQAWIFELNVIQEKHERNFRDFDGAMDKLNQAKNVAITTTFRNHMARVEIAQRDNDADVRALAVATAGRIKLLMDKRNQEIAQIQAVMHVIEQAKQATTAIDEKTYTSFEQVIKNVIEYAKKENRPYLEQEMSAALNELAALQEVLQRIDTIASRYADKKACKAIGPVCLVDSGYLDEFAAIAGEGLKKKISALKATIKEVYQERLAQAAQLPGMVPGNAQQSKKSDIVLI